MPRASARLQVQLTQRNAAIHITSFKMAGVFLQPRLGHSGQMTHRVVVHQFSATQTGLHSVFDPVLEHHRHGGGLFENRRLQAVVAPAEQSAF
eukprot:CAMPEP_0184979636 /NCGR_PEP_ID=MMETSP1098-20130426/9844_1 /TAXON_ID=89044 /ORGANISM="Spumella elongata, Strain CCAP 955/1" /LENGTH=92 /DNA_ID=CAMNT_0027502961 /DNA_START=81 /DNA_END=359 /DNA_ORIENTATION=+